MPEDLQQILKTAIEAAQKAGKYLSKNWGTLTKEAIGEKQKNDFVTKIDQAAEKIIISHIQAQFPRHSIMAEEGSGRDDDHEYKWIVDPLDGTLNYIKLIPMFCVSIAVSYRNQLIAGVVYNPILNELFSALKGGGAKLNNLPIKVSSESDFSRAFLATGFPHHSKMHLPQFIRSLSEMLFYSAGIRRLGAAALDLCYTACGRFDGFWELGLKPWDVAAGSLIVREAGGIVTDFNGGQTFMETGLIVAGNPPIHHYIQNNLNHFFERCKSERK